MKIIKVIARKLNMNHYFVMFVQARKMSKGAQTHKAHIGNYTFIKHGTAHNYQTDHENLTFKIDDYEIWLKRPMNK